MSIHSNKLVVGWTKAKYGQLGGNWVEVRTSDGENKRWREMPHYGLDAAAAVEATPDAVSRSTRIHCCLLRSQLSLTCQHVLPETVHL